MYLSRLHINVGENPDRPDWRICRKWLRNLYRVHQRLCMGFPSKERAEADPQFLKPWDPADFPEQRYSADKPAGDVAPDVLRQVHAKRDGGSGFLFRIDLLPDDGVVILVQSALKPDWEYAFHNADYLLKECAKVKPFDPGFSEGQLFQFRLRANPTVKRVQRDQSGQRNKQGKRVGIYDPDEQREWLAKKGRGDGGREPGGFRVVSCDPTPEGKSVAGKPNPKAPRNGASKSGDDGPKWIKMPHLSVLFEGVLEVTDSEAFLETLRGGIGSAKAFGFGLLSLARA